MSLNRRIGKLIEVYRTNRGLTQEELASRLGLTRGYLSDLERGVKHPSIPTLARICNRTGIKSAAFLGV